jgi:hypothetical protein
MTEGENVIGDRLVPSVITFAFSLGFGSSHMPLPAPLQQQSIMRAGMAASKGGIRVATLDATARDTRQSCATVSCVELPTLTIVLGG